MAANGRVKPIERARIKSLEREGRELRQGEADQKTIQGIVFPTNEFQRVLRRCERQRMFTYARWEQSREALGVEPMYRALRFAPSTYFDRHACAHNSDRISVRTKPDAAMAEAEIDLSDGAVGEAYDNALAECVIGPFITEVINQIGPWKSMREVECETLKWMDSYSNRRLLGPIPDAESKRAFYVNLNTLDMVAWSLNKLPSGKPGWFKK
jgi:putative transposase